MPNLSVTQKLWLGVASIVLGATLIVGYAGYNSARHQSGFAAQDLQLSQRLDQASQWSALAQVHAVRLQAALASADAQDTAALLAQNASTEATIDSLHSSLQASNSTPAAHAALDALVPLRSAVHQQAAQALQLHSLGQLPAAQGLARGALRQAAQTYEQALQTYVQQQAQALAQMRADMGAARQGVVRTAAVHMVFLLVGITVGAWLLIGSIRRALQQANTMAQQMAAGDLRSQLHSDRRDEFGQLLHSLQHMQQSLSQMIGDVRHSGAAVTLASSEMASGNHDLSQRTEITASHLQHAAASLMQLTEALQTTASHAQQAAGLAHNACSVAQRGGAEVNEVVTTMTQMHQSSQQIADIVGVIDGIAFQTNILALNAAVEAARAGEQGRGFAVVASEVRTLAQRSAQAAKEIKLLIQNSVQRMAQGAQLVQNAGSTMAEVVQAIQQVTRDMQHINACAAQQRDGIAQVNTAVHALDEMTQQNAALVEQSAATAHSLRAQSEHLQHLVQRFQVQEDRPPLHSGPASIGSHGQPLPAAPALTRRPQTAALLGHHATSKSL